MVLLASAPNPAEAAAATIRRLSQSLRDDREAQGLTVRAQALLVGVAADTLTRLDAGSNPTQSTILACLDYLARR